MTPAFYAVTALSIGATLPIASPAAAFDNIKEVKVKCADLHLRPIDLCIDDNSVQVTVIFKKSVSADDKTAQKFTVNVLKSEDEKSVPLGIHAAFFEPTAEARKLSYEDGQSADLKTEPEADGVLRLYAPVPAPKDDLKDFRFNAGSRF
ncbi:hypothetical protein HCU64_18245 [Methylobacterium sp. C25]|uniref:hypothetical protein n=1 Tax=Methylobacterium sp. C25 TaxID=2721622 RepID=UPI001F15BCFE|nr:hypothetical protein [Methylobacterium sp. C25]MCE4225697.1 hypothetical protein [Methylobacterium sp. C25]